MNTDSLSWPALLCMLAVAVAFWAACHQRSLRETWKQLTGPHWFAAWISYFFLIGAFVLFCAFYGSGSRGAWYQTPWRSATLIGSIGLFFAFLGVQVRYMDSNGMKLRRKNARKSLGQVRKTGFPE